ncbi:hypothetical protein AUR04nite_12530 [Glutamicibacter uratoxydans]|uniref:Uncharacterized protein n=1 Tax=Glutamicibacter uratoxydans TaxID=43667 RepID=A0A4Y4DTA3_GLUUR|nr:hypothetical protein AUR04nite_12530 [Glutamicibacter uratoxydans]
MVVDEDLTNSTLGERAWASQTQLRFVEVEYEQNLTKRLVRAFNIGFVRSLGTILDK